MLIFGALLALPMGLILGLLGGGGSILTLPILVYALGIGTKEAIATSLLIVGLTSAVGTVQHARAGHVQYRVGSIFGVFAMIGAYGGGLLAGFMPGKVLLLMFVALMIAASVFMLRPRNVNTAEKTFAPLQIMLDGVIVGGITGMVGAGGGFVVVPALVLFGGLSMRAAIGTSLLVITLKAFAALAGHLGHVSIDLALVAAITAPAIVGSIIGTWLSKRLPAHKLKHLFAYFVLVMAGFMLYQETAASLIAWLS